MTFAKLKSLALAMSEEERTATLKQLCNDPRFAAVLALADEQKNLASDNSSKLAFASNHGCLAHAAGVRYAWLELENSLRAVCTPEKGRRKSPPPPPDTEA